MGPVRALAMAGDYDWHSLFLSCASPDRRKLVRMAQFRFDTHALAPKTLRPRVGKAFRPKRGAMLRTSLPALIEPIRGPKSAAEERGIGISREPCISA
jgi:hypothetical protein